MNNPQIPSSVSTITGELIPLQQYNIKEIQDLIDQLPYKDNINIDDYIEIDNSLKDIDISNEKIVDLVQKMNLKKQLIVLIKF